MKITFLIPALLCCFMVKAQKEKPNHKYTFRLSAGKSIAGSGDIAGLYLRLGIEKKVKRWSFSLSQTTTIHDGSHPIFYEYPAGYMQDASIRFSVTGLELTPMAGYSILSLPRHDVQFSLGAVLRYQSNGDNDYYSLYYPAATGLPFPVLVMHNVVPVRTLNAGGIAQLSYDIRLCSRWTVGAAGSFQTDTNGDVFLNYGIRCGYQFN